MHIVSRNTLLPKTIWKSIVSSNTFLKPIYTMRQSPKFTLWSLACDCSLYCNITDCGCILHTMHIICSILIYMQCGKKGNWYDMTIGLLFRGIHVHVTCTQPSNHEPLRNISRRLKIHSFAHFWKYIILCIAYRSQLGKLRHSDAYMAYATLDVNIESCEEQLCGLMYEDR
jgi:hypothetical protein